MSPSRVVCDASAIVMVLLDSGEDGAWLARRLAEAELYAPTLLPFECSNVIRRHEVGGLISSTALNLVVVPALFNRWGIGSDR